MAAAAACSSLACCRRHPRACHRQHSATEPPRFRATATTGAVTAAAEAASALTERTHGTGTAHRLQDWVCTQAAAARSSTIDCKGCSWWTPVDLIAPMRSGRNLPHLLPRHAATTVWFICVSKPASEQDTLNSKHLELATAAVASARLHAPSLAPHVMYIHRPDQPLAADDAFARRLRSLGARVLPHRLSFYDAIPQAKLTGGSQRHLNFAAFGRLDIPRVVDSMRPELRARGLDSERVLYTDTDVLFAADFDVSRRFHRVRYFAVGTEAFSETLNSGVMYLNVSAMAAEWPRMLEYAVRRSFKFHLLDQTLLRDWFETSRCSGCKSTPSQARQGRRRRAAALQRLDDAVYNARGFMHPQRPLQNGPVIVPHIWHWHGYKPHDVACWIAAIRNGAWPASAWLDLPVQGSGCRFFSAITMGRCYLRTYAFLLTQHRRLLRFAEFVAGELGNNRTQPGA
jgi:hypothetical protein